MRKKFRIRLSHTQIIALGFLIIIIIGTLLLLLPAASRDGRSTPFVDCLFTSTSASCVTGLIVTDTASHWTLFGQIVILILIQIGGLGFMTFITFFFILMRRRVGLQERQIMTESINASNVGEILGLTRVILIGTAIFEVSGAALLSIRFIPRFGVLKGIWFGIFHSVSAFCNAGFDILGSGGISVSLTEYADDPLVNIVVMLLVIIGGLGFLVWDDLRRHRFKWKRYRLQTKCVLFMTAVLVLGGAILFFVFEKNYTGAGKTVGERVLAAFFGSVTARTAGFNTTETAELSGPSTVLNYILMFIGGNSGSTAGGVKTTSVLVIIVFAVCGIRREHGANIFGRRLHEDSLSHAVYIVAANLSAVLIATLIIGAIQPFPLDKLLFETFSAIGTVGISAGITSSLNTGSRMVIVLLMYMGRVGSVSFGLALLEKKARPPVTYPTEQIIVG